MRQRQAISQCRARAPGGEGHGGAEGSLVVLAKLKELEFHSRANLERLAELTLTVEDELKQKEIVSSSRPRCIPPRAASRRSSLP